MTTIGTALVQENQSGNLSYTINRFLPSYEIINSEKTNITINNKLVNKQLGKHIDIPGQHSIDTCALNISKYTSNTAFIENKHLSNNTIKPRQGLDFVLLNKKNKAITRGITTDFSSPEKALVKIQMDKNVRKIVWLGYIYAKNVTNVSITSSNLHIWIGENAFRLYNNNNTTIASNNTNANITLNANTYTPIRIIYEITDINKINFNITFSNSDISLVRLYIGKKPYYRPQTFYSLIKNDKTTDNNNFTCRIFGSLKKDKKNNITYITNPKKLPVTPISVDTSSYKPQSMSSKNLSVNYTYSKDLSHNINILKADDKINKTIITNSSNNTSYYTLNNNRKLFKYNSNNFSEYQNTFPINMKKAQEKSKTNCQIDCSNNRSCQGFYSISLNNGKNICQPLTDQNSITFLPQQKTFINASSNLFIKHPTVNKSDRVDVTYNNITDQNGYTSNKMSFSPYNKNELMNEMWQKSRVNNKTVSNTLSVALKLPFSTLGQVVEGNTGITTPASFPESDQISRIGTTPKSSNFMTNSQMTIGDKYDIPSKNTSSSNKQNITVMTTPPPPPPTPLLLFFPLENTTESNQSSYKDIVANISTNGTKWQDNKKTVIKCGINQMITFPSFDLFTKGKNNQLSKYINDKDISFSIQFKSGFVENSINQTWDIFNFANKKTSFRLYVDCSNSIIQNLCLSINNMKTPIKQSIKNIIKDQWNNIVVIYTKNNVTIYLNEQSVINYKIATEKITSFTNNKIGNNNLTEIKKESGKTCAKYGSGKNKNVCSRWSLTYTRYTPRDAFYFSNFKLYNIDVTKDNTILQSINKEGFETLSSININNPMGIQYSILEGFNEKSDIYNVNLKDAANIISRNMNDISNSSVINDQKNSTIQLNRSLLSQNITHLNSNIQWQTDQMNTTGLNNNTGGVIWEIDPNGRVVAKNPNLTRDIIKQDLDKLIIQQNTVYITGTIACASLLIAAIMIGSK